MAARLAFFTLGVLKAPVGDEVVQGFVDRLAPVHAAAEGSAVTPVQLWIARGGRPAVFVRRLGQAVQRRVA